MKFKTSIFILLTVLLGTTACSQEGTPSPTMTLTAIATAKPTLAPTRATPSSTMTMTATAIPTAPDPAATATAIPTEPAPTPRPTATPKPRVEEISFQSDHFTLVGDLQIPNTEGKHPVVIMVHGDGPVSRTGSGTYRPIMARFLSAGYAVFSWDKPGTGASTGEFVDGAYLLSDRASILVDAVQTLKEHPDIDPQRIGAWGISQAGYVMPLALRMTDDIAFMIADAFFNPIEVVEQTTIPVLAFFGDKDTQVDPFQGAQAYEDALQKAGNQNFHVELIPGVAHGIDFAETGCMDEYRRTVYAPEYLDSMEEWLVQLLEPGD